MCAHRRPTWHLTSKSIIAGSAAASCWHTPFLLSCARARDTSSVITGARDVDRYVGCSYVVRTKLSKRETRLHRPVARHIPRQLRFLCCWRSCRARRCASPDGRSSELCGLDSLVLDECGALAAKSATGDGLDRRTAARASHRHKHRRASVRSLPRSRPGRGPVRSVGVPWRLSVTVGT